MNELFIQSITIDWNRISDDSYLRWIEALNNMQSLHLNKQITIFTGENGSGKSTPIRNFMMLSDCSKGTDALQAGIFLGPKAFIM